MPPREEVLVAVVPVTLRVERGPQPETIEILVEGVDPIVVSAAQRILLRPEGHGVVLERETLPQ